jgi:DNA polymerase I-like protein with 3'-5' exonuclease and polymerase domains
MRGYPIWDSMLNCWIMPIVHPDFMRQGHSDYGTVILHDFARAQEIATNGLQRHAKTYLRDPLVPHAWHWAHNIPFDARIAFDIETPWKSEDESELDFDNLGETQRKIDRISFAYKAHHAMSLEWIPINMPVIRHILGLNQPKVVWNESFDVPIIRGNGVEINGPIHDGMVMWHILHPGLPKKLGFVATFLCPDQERWKHLSHVQPAFYNATDSDIEWRCVEEAERQLRAIGRWHVYQQQVMAVNVPLGYMSRMGMPIRLEARMEAAEKLDALLDSNFTAVQEAVPDDIKKLEAKKPKKLPKGAKVSEVLKIKEVKVCSKCGCWPVTKTKHTTPKKSACYGAEITKQTASVLVPAILHPFNANSPKQILEYFKAKGIQPVMKKTKDGMKATTDEKSIKILRAKHPEDQLLPLILHRRKLEKLSGTYVGRIEDVS